MKKLTTVLLFFMCVVLLSTGVATGEIPIVAQGMIISTDQGSSFAIKYDGTLWAWGRNNYGQLGDGTTIDRDTPVKILDEVVAVSTGVETTMAIRADGSLWGWGRNRTGQLGDGTTINRYTPTKVMDGVVYVTVGSGQTMAIRTDGHLWAWGANMPTLCAESNMMSIIPPTKILEDVVGISACDDHATAIRTDGTLWAWGSHASPGMFGDSHTTHSDTPIKIMDNVIAVSTSRSDTMAIRTDGSLWAWGFDDGSAWGQPVATRTIPARIMENVVDVSVGFTGGAFALKADGTLWEWDLAQLGCEDTHGYVMLQIAEDVAAISAGGIVNRAEGLWDSYIIVVKADGSLWKWSSNRFGLIDDDATTFGTEPMKIMENVMLPVRREHQVVSAQVELRFVIGQTQYTHNGTPLNANVAPFIDSAHNRTMVPLRVIAEAFGAVASWDSATRTANIAGARVNLSLNLDTPLPDGMGIPINISGNIFVPLVYVSQQFGATTRWDRDAQAVYVMW